MNAITRIRATVIGLAVIALPVLGATTAIAATPDHTGTVNTATVAGDPTDDDTPWG